jgi:hypothetical protein
MTRAVYIADVTVVASKKRIKRKIVSKQYPMTLNEDGTIPADTLNRQLFKLVKSVIDIDHFKEYSYTFTIDSYKFSSKIYGT